MLSYVCLFLFSQSRVSRLLVVGCNVRGQMSTYLDCCLLPSLNPASVVCLRTRGAGAESCQPGRSLVQFLLVWLDGSCWVIWILLLHLQLSQAVSGITSLSPLSNINCPVTHGGLSKMLTISIWSHSGMTMVQFYLKLEILTLPAQKMINGHEKKIWRSFSICHQVLMVVLIASQAPIKLFSSFVVLTCFEDLM